MASLHPIGIFDSGYGGLTVFRAIREQLPQYDYIYLGDNGRAPYGDRSFETVYEYTLECVAWFFRQGCPLVILACNTASAKALRSIQQQDLPRLAPDNRVLGVIRPTAELAGTFSRTGSVGVLGTRGTVRSGSYPIEMAKYFPALKVYQQACPMWVPLIENGEHTAPEADPLIQKPLQSLLAQSSEIDTVILGCTHYPLLLPAIRRHLPAHIRLVAQGDIVADSLADYLQRHPEMAQRLSAGGTAQFFTTDAAGDFDAHASVFFGGPVASQHLHL